MFHRTLAFLAGLLIVTAAELQSDAASVVVDRVGDAFNFGGWNLRTTPDLLSASVLIHETNAAFSVRVAPGSFPSIDPATGHGTTFISFYLDMDQNPATGRSYSNPSSDANVLGWERRIRFSTASNLASLSNGSFNTLAQVPAVGLEDGFDAVVPLSLLDGDSAFNFKLITSVQLKTQPVFTTTTIVDRLPDEGLAAGSTVPEPASIVLFAACWCASPWLTRSQAATQAHSRH